MIYLFTEQTMKHIQDLKSWFFHSDSLWWYLRLFFNAPWIKVLLFLNRNTEREKWSWITFWTETAISLFSNKTQIFLKYFCNSRYIFLDYFYFILNIFQYFKTILIHNSAINFPQTRFKAGSTVLRPNLPSFI